MASIPAKQRSDYILCTVGDGRKSRNPRPQKRYLPFRRELLTWAHDHREKSKQLERQLLEMASTGREIPGAEFVNLLHALLTEAYGLGMIDSDLAEGRFR